MNKSRFFALSLVAVSFLIAIYFYPWMPEQVASHWDANGNVNGYMPRFWGLFLMPIMSMAMLILFIALPLLDPLKKNVQKFRLYYDGFICMLMAFMFYLFMLTLAWNLGLRFDMMQMLVPAFSILFYFCGIMIQNSKRNWFMGIRTPWTMSSDRVWDKTHAIGGKLYKAAAIISLSGLLFPGIAIWLLIGPIILVSVFTVVYSYVKYRALA